ncbi:MAG TPA: glycosyltransferase family 4 protein [Candidatus Paceibacterota bacterium]
MKRILIFSLNYYPNVGGADIAVKEITDRISPEDIEFHMVAHRFDRHHLTEERVGQVVVHRIGGGSSRFSKFLYQFRAPLVVARLHQHHHVDATWAMMAHSAGVPAALFKLFYPRIPMLLTLQEGDPLPYIERMMRPVWPLFSRAFTHADAIQAISTFLADWARRRGARGPIEVIPNGVDIAHFSREYPSAAVAITRQSLGARDGDTLLVTTSRLVRKNAVDDVIRALAELPPSVRFIVYGVGPDEVALKALARELGVEDRVRFMGQALHEDLPLALAACDIFIRPSRSEGMGNSFIEAMAASIPVIATQEGGIADFLFDEKRNPGREPTGWAVDPDAPEQIARTVEDILAHPAEVARVTANARTLVREKYDWNLIAEKMRTLFDRLLDAQKR